MTAGNSGDGFFDALSNVESNHRNILSGVDEDYPGQPGSRSQGFFQIDVPTWQQFAPKVGVDTSRYPTPMSDPTGDIQKQVAAAIPFGRFGPRTQKMMTAQFGPLDKTMTVGDLAAKTPGTTLTSVPGPDVGRGVGGGQGGVTPQSAQTPAADDGKPKSIWDYLRKASDAISENKTDKDGKEIPGTSLADKIGSQFDPKPSAGGGAPEMNLGMGGGAQQPDTYGPAAQAFAAQLQQQMQQPVWTPPPAGQQGVPGTTLNSLALIKQLYG